jgi:hypothetical protein
MIATSDVQAWPKKATMHDRCNVKLHILTDYILSVLYVPGFFGNNSEFEMDSKVGYRNVYGFTFALVENFVVTRKPIRKKDLRNRIDNERYYACQYNVDISYKGIPVRVDFSRDITLQRIREVGQYESVITAFFRYSADGWAAAGDDVAIAPSEITKHERANSLAVSGIVHRKNQETQREDFCFSLDVIGEEKYLTGAVCRPTKAELEPLRALFSKQSIVWAER